jgi:4-diphosphocytidyl-2-C-methyl-D-erythritol kinase
MARATSKKRSVRLPAFAKINLCLHVMGKRSDGYHELRTIFQTISLHDTLEISIDPGGSGQISLSCNDVALPLGPDNLVWRAVEAIGPEIGFRGSISVQLDKKIPVARGLGGGSSDAAATLIGMMRLTRSQVPLPRLMEIAASLGADVPFFLFGGRAWLSLEATKFIRFQTSQRDRSWLSPPAISASAPKTPTNGFLRN